MVLVREVSVEFGDVGVVGKRVVNPQLLGELFYHIVVSDSRFENFLQCKNKASRLMLTYMNISKFARANTLAQLKLSHRQLTEPSNFRYHIDIGCFDTNLFIL